MSDAQLLTDEIRDAVLKFHKADEFEKKGKELRAESRATILEGLTSGSITAGDLIVGEVKVKVTVPMSKVKPAEFDQEKAQEFKEFCEDTYRFLLPAFTTKTTHIVNIEVLFALMKAVEDETDNASKIALLDKIERYIIPEVGSVAMEPRVKAS